MDDSGCSSRALALCHRDVAAAGDVVRALVAEKAITLPHVLYFARS